MIRLGPTIEDRGRGYGRKFKQEPVSGSLQLPDVILQNTSVPGAVKAEKYNLCFYRAPSIDYAIVLPQSQPSIDKLVTLNQH